MRQIAIYGKGGIGKSTITANLAVALAERGLKVLQVGCDPKHDSTRMLLGGTMPPTVLDCLRERGEEHVEAEMVVRVGYRGVWCVEAGGPEPGIGCAGRGIMATFELLDSLGIFDSGLDVVLYDVLGDVVCGGFAVPIREGYARETYLVTSGELMSLYAANNICRGIARFANRGEGRLGGIVGNSRVVDGEVELIDAFARRLGSQLVQFIPRDPIVQRAELHRQTVLQYAPESTQAGAYRELATRILNNEALGVPRPMGLEELETLMREVMACRGSRG
ncbi:MAG: nitrogenase iron protein [Chloroflexi bacterium]|nr:nitrogenase iron protein [Chloroflexota bacterium]